MVYFSRLVDHVIHELGDDHDGVPAILIIGPTLSMHAEATADLANHAKFPLLAPGTSEGINATAHNEFLCQSCFLLLPLRRLADPKRQFCDDCA